MEKKKKEIRRATYKKDGLTVDERTAQNKEILLENLERFKGLVATACKVSDIGRATYYYWFEKDDEFSKKAEQINEQQVDMAEAALFNKISNGDTASIIFYLKTKGKHRGYTQKFEVEADISPLLKSANKAMKGMSEEDKESLINLAESLDYNDL